MTNTSDNSEQSDGKTGGAAPGDASASESKREKDKSSPKSSNRGKKSTSRDKADEGAESPKSKSSRKSKKSRKKKKREPVSEQDNARDTSANKEESIPQSKADETPKDGSDAGTPEADDSQSSELEIAETNEVNSPETPDSSPSESADPTSAEVKVEEEEPREEVEPGAVGKDSSTSEEDDVDNKKSNNQESTEQEQITPSQTTEDSEEDVDGIEGADHMDFAPTDTSEAPGVGDQVVTEETPTPEELGAPWLRQLGTQAKTPDAEEEQPATRIMKIDSSKPDAKSKTYPSQLSAPEAPQKDESGSKAKAEASVPQGEASPLKPSSMEDSDDWLEREPREGHTVAKTLLETDTSKFRRIFQEQEQDEDQEPEQSSEQLTEKTPEPEPEVTGPRVARTMLEVDIPAAVEEIAKGLDQKENDSIPADKNEHEDRVVARTLLEAPIPSIPLEGDPQQQTETGTSEPEVAVPENAVPSDADQNHISGTVHRTMLETRIPDHPTEEPQQSNDQNAPIPQSESSPAATDRVVSKTMIETDIPSAISNIVASEAVEARQSYVQEPTNQQLSDSGRRATVTRQLNIVRKGMTVEKGYRLSRSMVDLKKPNSDSTDQDIHGETGLSDTQYGASRPENYIAKTMIDKELLYSELALSMQRMETVAEEQRKEREKEPPVEVEKIENFKISAKCPWKWESEYGKSRQRVAFCEQCGIPVYDLEGMQMPEVKALIFQRENTEKFTLFKRGDGKFTTKNCPIAVKKRNDGMVLLTVLILLAVLGGSIFFMIPPSNRAPQQTEEFSPNTSESTSESPGTEAETNAQTQVPTQAETTTPAANQPSQSGASQSPDGAYHWKAGEPVPEAPASVPEEQPATESKPDPNSPYADESGKFWEFSD